LPVQQIQHVARIGLPHGSETLHEALHREVRSSDKENRGAENVLRAPSLSDSVVGEGFGSHPSLGIDSALEFMDERARTVDKNSRWSSKLSGNDDLVMEETGDPSSAKDFVEPFGVAATVGSGQHQSFEFGQTAFNCSCSCCARWQAAQP
jgi:hypothetical protein